MSPEPEGATPSPSDSTATRPPATAPSRNELAERLHQLECDVIALRRRLGAGREQLPTEPFQALEVRAGGTRLAIDVTAIVEVLPMLATRPMADAPPWVYGAFRHGDDLVPTIDLGRRLDGRARPPRLAMRLVVLDPGRDDLRRTALAVDEVHDLLDLEPDEIVPPRDDLALAPFLLGHAVLDDREVAILSVERACHDFLLGD